MDEECLKNPVEKKIHNKKLSKMLMKTVMLDM